METQTEEIVEQEITMADFFETILQGGLYEVKTPQGWKQLKELVKKPKQHCYKISLENGMTLSASDDHLLKNRESWISVKEIEIGHYIETELGFSKVIDKKYLGSEDTYDFEVDSEEHSYYSNAIISHNTGKTTIGHLICNSSKTATVIWITPDLIAENNVGKTSIKLLYMLADFVAPSVIVLEDLDLFSEDREGVVDQLRLGALMNILDGVNSVKNAVTVATTNRIGLIEKALSNRPGRFDSVVEVPPLDDKLRTKMFKSRFKECNLETDALDELIKSSDEWTGAECQEFVNRTNLYFINRNEDKNRHVTLDVVKAVLAIMERMVVGAKSRRKISFA